jgi:hypothetical protein
LERVEFCPAELRFQSRFLNHPDELKVGFHIFQGDARVVFVVNGRGRSVSSSLGGGGGGSSSGGHVILIHLSFKPIQEIFVEIVVLGLDIIASIRCRGSGGSGVHLLIKVFQFRGRRTRFLAS